MYATQAVTMMKCRENAQANMTMPDARSIETKRFVVFSPHCNAVVQDVVGIPRRNRRRPLYKENVVAEL